MCGIAGIIAFKGGTTKSRLKAMTDAIAHRGPDGEGHWVDASGSVGLGHRRLSIIDVSDAGCQPMAFLNDRYTIIFNGEIYNYVELREACMRQGYAFHSGTDTEVIMALYDWKGVECLQEFDGMFAFALWDEGTKTLFCARDRFGEKPFFYGKDAEGNILYGSEMKALWAGGVPRNPDGGMIYSFLADSIIAHPQDRMRTFYEGIRKLPAAHYFVWKKGEADINPICYWRVDPAKRNTSISEAEAEATLRGLFMTSVKRRLRSDVPVGSSLSGGLDSSLVVCAINELAAGSGAGQKTFSAQFPGWKKDESRYQQMVIEACDGVQPHFIHPTTESMLERLATVARHQEEPFAHASICAQYEVFESAKKNSVTVMLDGQGADEVLAGYHYYFEPFFRGLRGDDLAKERAAYYARMQGNDINVQHRKDLKYYFKRLLPKGIQDRILSARSNAVGALSLLSEDFKRKNGQAAPQRVEYSDLQHALHYETFGTGLETLLRYADRNSMANSREVRLPFLSHELVAFIFSLPDTFKLHEGWTKWIMRETFKDIIPKAINWRTDKIGYEPPQNEWLKSPAFQAEVAAAAKTLHEKGILAKPTLPESTDAYLRWKVFIAAKTLF